jgi:electron transfer flavoprotein-quinone oxidoreductase
MPGLLVAGDAASLLLAAGIWLEGVNYAMASGLAAGRAINKGPRNAVSAYKDLLAADFVLKDHRRLRKVPELIFSPFVQRTQPGLVCDIAEGLFTVDNPAPKPGLRKIVRGAMRARGVSRREALATTWRAYRRFR